MSDHCLYRFFDAASQLLYVGITMNPSSRWNQHRKDKAWWVEVANITIEPHLSRPAALRAEQRAIRFEHPLWNVMHNRPKVFDIEASRCSFCGVEATYSQTDDLYFHVDGSDNGPCQWALVTGETKSNILVHESTILKLPAFRSNDSLKVWCDYWIRWHSHGAGGGNGHRLAHCQSPESPYRKTGYSLVEVGALTPEIERMHW